MNTPPQLIDPIYTQFFQQLIQEMMQKHIRYDPTQTQTQATVQYKHSWDRKPNSGSKLSTEGNSYKMKKLLSCSTMNESLIFAIKGNDIRQIKDKKNNLPWTFKDCVKCQRCNHSIHGIFKNLRLLKTPKTLDLDFNIYRVTYNDLLYLVKILKSFQGLHTIFLRHLSRINPIRRRSGGICLPTEIGNGILFQILRYVKSLKKLDMHFSECRIIMDQELEILTETLKSNNLLQDLAFNFESCPAIVDSSAILIQESLKDFKSLQSMDLGFSNCKGITDHGFASLKKNWKHLTSLKVLSLTFSQCPKITGITLEYLQNLLPDLTSLQILKLNFTSCHGLSDAGLLVFLRELKEFKLLITLDLNFSSINFSVLEFSFLQELPRLQNLSLNLSKCHTLVEETIKDLSDNLTLLTNLKTLHLDFNYEKFGVVCCISPLRYLSLVQKLFLDLGFVDDMNDSASELLQEGLKKLDFLRDLTLSFEGAKNLTDTGLQYLHEGLKASRLLKYFHLNVGRCYKISDHGLRFLKQGLKDLDLLQNFYFFCAYLPLITSCGLQSLYDALKCDVKIVTSY